MLLLFAMLTLSVFIGGVSAAEDNDYLNLEGSNLMNGNDDSLSKINKLEISNEYSISQTNTVNSHDDNLKNYSDSSVLTTSINEDNYNSKSVSNTTLLKQDNDVSNVVSINESTSKITTKLSIHDTHYTRSATYFEVTLKDKFGNALSKQNISLTVNGKTFYSLTNSNGVASIKTNTLSVGTYTASINYAGNSNYSAYSLSKKVNVLSSISGSDLTTYYGVFPKFKATFWKGNSVLANTKVTFKVNGKTYTMTTDKNGVASIPIKLGVGKYVMTAINPYSNEKILKNIVVKKDSTILSHGSINTYIIPNHKYSFTVTLKTAHNVLFRNAKVTFTFNHKTVTAKTNANGKATITIPVLGKGQYKISYVFAGNKNLKSDSDSGFLIVKNPTAKLSASNLKMKYNDGSKFTVKLSSASGKILANKTVKFIVNGKSSYHTTNSKGYAKHTIGGLKPGIYKVSYSYSVKGLKNYACGSSKVIIFKATAKISAKNLNMKKGDGSYFKVTVTDSAGKKLKNVLVKSVYKGKSYILTTDSKGIAKLKINSKVGYNKISSIVADPCYTSKTVSKYILVNGTKFIAENMYVSAGKSATFSVKLVDGKNVIIKNAKVTFTFKGKNTNVNSDSKGVAKIALGKLSKGQYTIDYVQGKFSGSSKIYSVDKISIKQIIASSKTVKNYIAKNYDIPSTVKIGSVSFSTEEYLYLASKAIANLKSGNKADISVRDVGSPSNLKSTSSSGNLYDYVSVAKKIVSTVDSTGVMLDSVSSKVGTIGYKNAVYAFSRVLVSYGSNNKLPSYVSIKSLSPISLTSDLNSKNIISNLAAYLAASTNCQVNNAQIKELVTKLTKDCKTDKEKATIIYEYVRDTLSYTFYYNTRYGAVGTLNAKTGNCVDHTHLLIAMFRTAGLAARYVHGTCTFSSGSTYGHVWSQVLIGDTWVVADATSSRNSLGKVVNWNSNSYKLSGYFASISF